MLTVHKDTNLHKFIRYIEPAVEAGNREYWVWKKGPIPDRLGAWAENYRRARKWARETRSGVLVGWPFRGSALLDQGHVGILLPSGFVLQCFSDPNGPDLNWNYTIEQFGHGVKHALMVHPKNWIEYRGDLADWAREREGKKGK